MDEHQQNPIHFSKKGAWLGLIAYIVVALAVAAVFVFG